MWDAALEFGSVGILTVLIVELGKRLLPGIFVSDMNVWNSVVIAVVLNGIYTYTIGGDVWGSIPHGATIGLAVAGAYRGVSLSAKRNSIDMSEQAVDFKTIAKATMDEDDDRHDDGMVRVKGFVGK